MVPLTAGQRRHARPPRQPGWAFPIVAALIFFPVGIPAVVINAKARRLARDGDRHGTQAAADRARNLAWIAIGVGLTLYAVLFIILLLTLNDGAVRQGFFNISQMQDGWKTVWTGFKLNVSIALTAEALVLVWALVIAVVRSLPGRAAVGVRFLAVAYTDVFRGLPAVIVIYLIGLGIPLAGIPVIGKWSAFQFAVLALTLVYGAYVSEVYRSGIDSIHPSQVSAARSLGLSYAQTMRFVVVPQAVRRIGPPLLNDFIGLQKDTALVGFIGTLEAFNRARIVSSRTANLSAITLVALLFVAITIPQARLLDWWISRDQARMRASAK